MSTPQDNLSALDRDLRQYGQEPRRGWWSRNWKWFVPTVLLGCIVICCGGLTGIGFWWWGKMGLKPFIESVQKVQTNPQLTEALGEPIQQDSFLITPNVGEDEQRGQAKYYWDVKGPKGKAKIEMQARKMGGKWELIVLTATLSDGKTINLLEGEKGENDAPPFVPQKKEEVKKPEPENPPPNINLPLPKAG
jgi:hypothetical protein